LFAWQIGGLNNSGNSTKEDADEISVALGEIEFLDKLSREFLSSLLIHRRRNQNWWRSN
jgi:hypothetical protein